MGFFVALIKGNAQKKRLCIGKTVDICNCFLTMILSVFRHTGWGEAGGIWRQLDRAWRVHSTLLSSFWIHPQWLLDAQDLPSPREGARVVSKYKIWWEWRVYGLSQMIKTYAMYYKNSCENLGLGALWGHEKYIPGINIRRIFFGFSCCSQ